MTAGLKRDYFNIAAGEECRESTVSESVVYILFRRSFAMVIPIMKTPSGKVTHHHQPAMPYWYTY